MLLETGFFTQSQYDSFISHGCSYVDVDGIRYLSIDMMVFARYGIAFSSSHNSHTHSHAAIDLLTRTLLYVILSQLYLPRQ